MQWRPILLGLTAVLTFATGIGRYEKGSTGFLLVAPFVTALFSFIAALMTWQETRPRH